MSYQYNTNRKDATSHTIALHLQVENELEEKFIEEEKHDVAVAKKHLVYNYGENTSVDAPRPNTINPLLWRNNVSNHFSGVYELAKGYYAVTGIACCVIGFIRGKSGWIVLDTGAAVEESELSAKLVEQVTGEKVLGNVSNILITHTHYDHFAGIGTFLNAQTQTPTIYGPSEYGQSLVDDNLYAGRAMSRRLVYQGGISLPHDEKGTQGAGLQYTAYHGRTASFAYPTQFIDKEQTIELDGITFVFVPTPNTETRAHMAIYDRTHKVLALGDNSMGTLHNTYTPRGARTRDASFWGEVFYHLYHEFGDDAEAVFSGHGMAHFNSEEEPDHVKKYLLDNAVAYKFPSDQALLLANKGVKLSDIGRKIHIPDAISKIWYTRDHYGNYTFNARGSVNRVLGFYDGNPVNLWPLEEVAYAKKIITYIGSEELILEKAEKDFDKGEYQWVAQITSLLVEANPKNEKARLLCADALEQLGYQTQTALWRNMYLTGAQELRDPEAKFKGRRLMDNQEVMPYASGSLLFDYLGINFDGENGFSYRKKIGVELVTDNGTEKYIVSFYKGTVLYDQYLTSLKSEEAFPWVKLSKMELYFLGSKSLDTKHLQFENNQNAIALLEEIQSYVVDTSKYANFNIIEPLEEE